VHEAWRFELVLRMSAVEVHRREASHRLAGVVMTRPVNVCIVHLDVPTHLTSIDLGFAKRGENFVNERVTPIFVSYEHRQTQLFLGHRVLGAGTDVFVVFVGIGPVATGYRDGYHIEITLSSISMGFPLLLIPVLPVVGLLVVETLIDVIRYLEDPVFTMFDQVFDLLHVFERFKYLE
jgi:hypothetical protein